MNNKGFTLIELFVTSAILSILALLSFFNFRTFRERSSDTIAITSLRNAYTALSAAYSEGDFVNQTNNVIGYVDVDGTVSDSSSFSTDDVLIGYRHTIDTKLILIAYPSTFGVMALSHCRGSATGTTTSVFRINYNLGISGVVFKETASTLYSLAVGMPTDGSACAS